MEEVPKRIPETLQISPYLYIKNEEYRGMLRRLGLIRQRKRICDYRNSRHVPSGAAFLRLFEGCRFPARTADISRRYALSEAGLRDLLDCGFLVDPAEAWKATRISTVEIEISTRCNWRCRYCPVSLDPKPPATMDMNLFRDILDKAQKHQTVRAVQFDAYNEPALEEHFEDRVRLLAETRLKLRLYTNGSVLDEKKINLLKDTEVLEFVRFNLPSNDEEIFREMTGSPMLKQTLRNIDHAVSRGLPVELSIQGSEEEIARNIGALKRRFGPIAANEYRAMRRQNVTTDRAGAVSQGRYRKDVHVAGLLAGCRLPLTVVVISIHGDLYLCCEDYYQRNVFGNIRDGSLEEVMSGPKAERLRRQVFGAETAPDDFICRNCGHMKQAVERKKRDEG
ncbi:MAG: radical SAM protein [bacterium]